MNPDELKPEDFSWVILFLPLAAALAIALFTRRDPKLSAQLSIGAVLAAFFGSLALFLLLKETRFVDATSFRWLSVGALNIEMGVRLDPLSLLMMLIVTGVGGAIHVYSFGYMREDPGLSRYFACLSLFTFSMLGIVMANNFVQMFIFWELVGLSSYLLIGFWHERPSAAEACKKAFLTNRLGDFGFLVGILLIWGIVGSVKFDEVEARLIKDPQFLGANDSPNQENAHQETEVSQAVG